MFHFFIPWFKKHVASVAEWYYLDFPISVFYTVKDRQKTAVSRIETIGGLQRNVKCFSVYKFSNCYNMTCLIYFSNWIRTSVQHYVDDSSCLIFNLCLQQVDLEALIRVLQVGVFIIYWSFNFRSSVLAAKVLMCTDRLR